MNAPAGSYRIGQCGAGVRWYGSSRSRSGGTASPFPRRWCHRRSRCWCSSSSCRTRGPGRSRRSGCTSSRCSRSRSSIPRTPTSGRAGGRKILSTQTDTNNKPPFRIPGRGYLWLKESGVALFGDYEAFVQIQFGYQAIISSLKFVAFGSIICKTCLKPQFRAYNSTSNIVLYLSDQQDI